MADREIRRKLEALKAKQVVENLMHIAGLSIPCSFASKLTEGLMACRLH